MSTKNQILTAADMTAVELADSNYINNKGANLYTSETYGQSVEYYHLAAAMGNVDAISNLGYCYLYGREVKSDLSLAIAYFKTAAKHNNVDAAYKLGDIYGSNKWGILDKELSIYYYRIAASFIIDENWDEPFTILYTDELINYPSLCFALGRELSNGGYMHTNLDCAYQFLNHAKIGYERALQNGDKMYQKSYQNVLKLLDSEQFDKVKIIYNDMCEDEN